ncbi:MAG TPA: UbiA family prenyltransferase [Nitrososphaera sp.]|nr:UbiA family prenyltransferase [Nitrososphaera sp.]
MSILTTANKKQGCKQVQQTSFFYSQLILFQSRKKWGVIYALAAIAGIFCVPEGIVAATLQIDPQVFIMRAISLPLAAFMIIVGMYVLNDLVDADLDKANGKKRPIPTGQVSKRQAGAFIGLTNGAGILFASMTLNPASAVIALLIVAIGIMYSAPKIVLKDRFVIKTLSIAFAMIFCALLGSTLTFGLNLTGTDLLISTYIALMLGSMVFITSPFNDMGDIAGDKAEGRRTIPIVIGRENTVKMAIILAASAIATSWFFYSISTISLATSILVSFVYSLTAMYMSKTLKRLDDTDYVRKQHKKSLPLHIMLQSAIIIGILLV